MSHALASGPDGLGGGKPRLGSGCAMAHTPWHIRYPDLCLSPVAVVAERAQRTGLLSQLASARAVCGSGP